MSATAYQAVDERLNTALHVLSNPRRRMVLHVVDDLQPVGVSRIAREVAAWETDSTVEDLSQQEYKRAYSTIYQTHLDKLLDAGALHEADIGFELGPEGQTYLDLIAAADRSLGTERRSLLGRVFG